MSNWNILKLNIDDQNENCAQVNSLNKVQSCSLESLAGICYKLAAACTGGVGIS